MGDHDIIMSRLTHAESNEKLPPFFIFMTRAINRFQVDDNFLVYQTEGVSLHKKVIYEQYTELTTVFVHNFIMIPSISADNWTRRIKKTELARNYFFRIIYL